MVAPNHPWRRTSFLAGDTTQYTQEQIQAFTQELAIIRKSNFMTERGRWLQAIVNHFQSTNHQKNTYTGGYSGSKK